MQNIVHPSDTQMANGLVFGAILYIVIFNTQYSKAKKYNTSTLLKFVLIIIMVLVLAIAYQ